MAKTDPVTDAQKRYLSDLIEMRDITGLSEQQQAFLKTTELWDNMNRGQASAAIETVRGCPFLPKPTQATQGTPPVSGPPSPVQGFNEGAHVVNATQPNGPEENTPNAGRYFIVDPTSSPPGKESFFHVSKGKEGTRWSDYTFLSIRASDDLYPIKEPDRRRKIYDEILKDPINAMNEYGMRLGVCGNCGRTLTDRDSRLRGMGPICAARILGAPTEEDLGILSQLGLLKD